MFSIFLKVAIEAVTVFGDARIVIEVEDRTEEGVEKFGMYVPLYKTKTLGYVIPARFISGEKADFVELIYEDVREIFEPLRTRAIPGIPESDYYGGFATIADAEKAIRETVKTYFEKYLDVNGKVETF